MNCLVTKGSINYEMIGSGFPIIIMHAMGTDLRSMEAWIEPIFNDFDGFQRIYIDLPAHGQSLINDNLNSSDDILINVLDFIDKKIPNQRFSLIGSSYGGYIAQGVLHQRRDKVQGICLLASALHLRERNLPAKVTYLNDTELLNSLDSDTRMAFETLMVYQNEKNLNYFLKEIQPGRLLANRQFLMSNWREAGYFLSEEPFQDVNELSQPALIICGREDSICGFRDYIPLLEKFPKSTFCILDQAGHMLQIEKREVVQELVKDWLVRTLQVLE